MEKWKSTEKHMEQGESCMRNHHLPFYLWFQHEYEILIQHEKTIIIKENHIIMNMTMHNEGENLLDF